jgi:hypothetical protein
VVADAAALGRARAMLKPGESVLCYVHRPGAGGNQYVVLHRPEQP